MASVAWAIIAPFDMSHACSVSGMMAAILPWGLNTLGVIVSREEERLRAEWIIAVDIFIG